MMGREQIEAIAAEHEKQPHLRHAQRELANAMTDLIHGRDERERAENAAQALFSGDVGSLDESLLDEVFADVPNSEHGKASLEGDGVPLVDLLAETTLAKSKREAREFLSNGAVSVNGERVENAERALKTSDLLHGRTILLRRGKKAWHATRWS